MAESAEKDSRTEEATEKRIRDTVEKGNLPFSREAPILASLLATLLFAVFAARDSGGILVGALRATFENPTQWDIETGADALHVLDAVALRMGAFLAPAAGLFLLAGLLASVLQNPPQLNLERVRPKWSNVSPVAGWSRLFGAKGFVEFGKAVFKFAAVSLIVGYLFRRNLAGTMSTMFADPAMLPETLLSLAMQLLSIVAVATMVLVAADLFLSRLNWRRDLRMSKQEVKDELKQQEGDPAIKARQRQIARERTRKRMMASVPKATLVIANPTHYAIALRYVREEGGAPMVVAKGTDLVALKIREIAEANGVPVFEDKLLARSMYDHVDVDRMIPQQFYKAVAELIYFLQSKVPARAGAA